MPAADRAEVSEIVGSHTASWDALARIQGDDEAGVAVRAGLEQLNQLIASPS